MFSIGTLFAMFSIFQSKVNIPTLCEFKQYSNTTCIFIDGSTVPKNVKPAGEMESLDENGLIMRNFKPNDFEFDEVVKMFSKLVAIEMSDCGLSEIHQRNLRNLPNLGYLNISHNQIAVLEENLLLNVPKLEVFDVSHNRILQIHFKAFNGMPVLKFINLSFNNISKVDHRAFLDIPNLKTLSFEGNVCLSDKKSSAASINAACVLKDTESESSSGSKLSTSLIIVLSFINITIIIAVVIFVTIYLKKRRRRNLTRQRLQRLGNSNDTPIHFRKTFSLELKSNEHASPEYSQMGVYDYNESDLVDVDLRRSTSLNDSHGTRKVEAMYYAITDLFSRK